MIEEIEEPIELEEFLYAKFLLEALRLLLELFSRSVGSGNRASTKAFASASLVRSEIRFIDVPDVWLRRPRVAASGKA